MRAATQKMASFSLPFKNDFRLSRAAVSLLTAYLDARSRGRKCQAVEQILVGVFVGKRNRRRRYTFLERQEPEREVLRRERRHLSWSRIPQGKTGKTGN